MLKKIVIAFMLIAPISVFAQSFKFGHTYSGEIIVLMPEYTKMQSDLQALSKQYSDELQRTEDELTKKYQELQTAGDSLPKNIQERRAQEISDMNDKYQQFREEASQKMQQKQQELITPIVKKLQDAIKEVGQAEGYTYIFELSNTAGGLLPAIPFVNDAQSTDVTPKVKAKLGIK